MNDFLKRSWAQVDLDAIRNNVEELRRSLSPGTAMMAVVKADAYGHGVEQTAPELLRCGCDWFAVSNIEEALQLRALCPDTPILILGHTPPEYALALAVGNLSQTVQDLQSAERLSLAARQAGVQVAVHLKIDTGMSRLGLIYHDSERDSAAVADAKSICALPNLYPEGIFTHFACADEPGEGELFTRLQFDLFLDILTRLRREGIEFPLRHCCNSAASILYPEMHLDMIRPGVALYGLAPCAEAAACAALVPALQLKSSITQIKVLAADTPVSYGRTASCARHSRVAAVPIGYADGYPRALSGRAEMLVSGKRAPVLGRICMDQCVLDVTDIPGLREGDTVTVIGRDGGECILADTLARQLDTIHYELLCGIGKRVPRVYTRGGETVACTNHLR